MKLNKKNAYPVYYVLYLGINALVWFAINWLMGKDIVPDRYLPYLLSQALIGIPVTWHIVKSLYNSKK